MTGHHLPPNPVPPRGTWKRAFLVSLVFSVAMSTLAILVAVHVSSKALDKANTNVRNLSAVCIQQQAVNVTLASLLDRFQATSTDNAARTPEQNAAAQQFYGTLLKVLRPAVPKPCPVP